MEYHVELASRARKDLEDLFLEKQVESSGAAALCHGGLQRAVLSLEQHPFRCQLAPEATAWKRDLRQLLYGKKPYVYRILFEIDSARAVVKVLHIRHGARFVPAPSGE
jgi:mRNA-degrading endonuclease RelE of RelBE toxin-antitoxin system